MSGRLDGQVAIVTGAGRGFGRSIALRLAAEGAAVTLTARTKTEIDGTLAEITAQGGCAQAIASDVLLRADVDGVIGATLKYFGPVTVMVNNAGMNGARGRLDEVDVNEWWAIQAVNVLGPVHYMQAVIPEMRRRHAGCIINVGSNSASSPSPLMSAYNTSKCALIRLTATVAEEIRKDGIGVFAIEPGRVKTKMSEETMAFAAIHPDADREKAEAFARIVATEDPQRALSACAQRCVDLAAGSYLALSGRFLLPEDDLDKLVAEAAR
jgi:NAD(P)-dependent dehydrogenase (short-subunit alcohol dehydrogenase family)